MKVANAAKSGGHGTEKVKHRMGWRDMERFPAREGFFAHSQSSESSSEVWRKEKGARPILLSSSAEKSGDASMIVTRASLLGAGAIWCMEYARSCSGAAVHCLGAPVP